MKKVVFIVLVLLLMLAMALPAIAAPPFTYVCHVTEGQAVTLFLPAPAANVHLAHGDFDFACPPA